MDYFDEEFEEILDRFKSHKKAYGDFAPGSWENLFDTDEETRRKRREELQREIDAATDKVSRITEELKSRSQRKAVPQYDKPENFSEWKVGMLDYLASEGYSEAQRILKERKSKSTPVGDYAYVPPAEVPLSNYDYHYEPKPKTESRFAAFLRRLGGEKEVVADEPVDQD